MYKRCSRCHKRLLTGTKCLCSKIVYKEYKKYRTDKEYQDIYTNKKWIAVRNIAKIRSNGLCEECIKLGHVSYMDDVHHIVPIKVNIKLAYDINNLICLCRSCHKEAHNKINSSL